MQHIIDSLLWATTSEHATVALLILIVAALLTALVFIVRLFVNFLKEQRDTLQGLNDACEARFKALNDAWEARSTAQQDEFFKTIHYLLGKLE